MKIAIFGYYNQNNTGDDLFRCVFEYIFKDHDVVFIKPGNAVDDMRNFLDKFDVFICGGGDVFTDYFMHRVVFFKELYENTYGEYLPCYAFSVGFSSADSIVENRSHYVDIFDYVIVRNKHDYNILKPRLGSHVDYCPDIVLMLNKIITFNDNNRNSRPFDK